MRITVLAGGKVPRKVNPPQKKEVADNEKYKEDDENGKGRPALRAAEGGGVVFDSGYQPADLIIENKGDKSKNTGVQTEGGGKVEAKEGVRGARDATGRTIDADRVQGAKENCIKKVKAIKEKK